MGIRGSLPRLKKEPTKLASMVAPAWLGTTGKAYWDQHSAWLVKHQLLTEQTAESFALLCDLWERVRAHSGEKTSRTYLDTVKAYQSLVKVFRLSPAEKAGYQPERHEEKEEFEFDFELGNEK